MTTPAGTDARDCAIALTPLHTRAYVSSIGRDGGFRVTYRADSARRFTAEGAERALESIRPAMPAACEAAIVRIPA